MAPREKQTLTGDRVITGRLTVYGGVNSPDVVKNITDVATTKEQVTQLETTVQEIADEPFGPAIRSSAPAIVIKADGTVVPEEITFQGVVKPLNGDPSFYLGIFKIYKDGDLYYTTPSAVTSLTWTVDIVQSLTPGPEVYPAINLYPSFSNRLITIELYDDTGTTLKDSMNISILPSWESYIQNELTDYTPKYIGKFNAAHPSSYHNGDWWLVYDTDDTPITRGVYRAINYTPTRVDGSDAANSQFMVAALPDILWASNNSYGDLSDYAPITYISNLVANAAFISNLFAQYIKIQTGGSIRGGDRYDEDGAVVDGTKPGFFISASGACKFAGVTFEGSQGGGVEWSSFVQIGNLFTWTSINESRITYLDNGVFAVLDFGTKTLRAIKWNGSSFSLVGSTYSMTHLSTYGFDICRINSTDVVVCTVSSTSTYYLATLRWNGSSWSVVGDVQTSKSFYEPRITSLDENTIIILRSSSGGSPRKYIRSGSLWVEDTIYSFSFDKTPKGIATIDENTFLVADYSLLNASIKAVRIANGALSVVDSFTVDGSGLASIPIVMMNKTDFAVIQPSSDSILMLRFDGYSITEVINGSMPWTDIILPDACSYNGTDMVIVDGVFGMRMARCGFSLANPPLH